METIPASCNSTQRKGEPEIITSKTTRFVRPVSDSKRTESTDPLSISSDLAGSRPRCVSFNCADSTTLEFEQGELEWADQASRAVCCRAAAFLSFLWPLAAWLALRALSHVTCFFQRA